MSGAGASASGGGEQHIPTSDPEMASDQRATITEIAADTSGPRIGVFESLRIRNFRLFAVGLLVSLIGTWMQNIAIGWLALQLSHSGTVVGIVAAARYAPILILGPWGGVISDRLDNRRLLMITQISAAVLSTTLATLSGTGRVTLPLLIGLELLLGVTNVFDNPPRQSIVRQLVDRVRLPNAIALTSTMINLAKVAGPGLAGIVISMLGVTPCFVLNAASFGAVVVSLILMRPTDMLPAQRALGAKGQIRASIRCILDTPSLRYPMLLVVVTGILTWEFPVSLPLLMTRTFAGGARAYGFAMAVMSLGAVAGGLSAAKKPRLSRRSLCWSCVLWGLAISAAALAPSLPIALPILALVGSGSVTFNSSAKTQLQLYTAPHMMGRVMSLWAMAWQGGTVIGAPLVGAIANAFGARSGLLMGGLAAIAVGGLVILTREPRASCQSRGNRA